MEGGAWGGEGVVCEFSRQQRRDARGSFGTAERREVGYMTPHSCNCRGGCKCVSCLLGCVPVRREEGGLGEKREERPASCAHPSSTTIRRAPPPTKASGCWYALDASCLSGAVAAESDHGNTTVRAPPANASSADPEEE